jgi:type I restriction enzyme S subunit
MSNWVTKPLGEIITLQRGHDLPSQDRNNGIVPIMGSTGTTGYHNKTKASGPGVVVGRSGNSMGEVSFSPVDYWPLNTCLYVTDFKGNDERYIYYLLQTIDFDQFNSGSAQKSLNRNAVYPYEVKTTECRNEQIRIGRVLADFEDKIELNRQTNQTLEQMAQAIFKSWFVDFEPTRAKIAAKLNGQDPERAAMAAISGKAIAELEQLSPDTQQQLRTTAALFTDELVDSELGEIPEGWGIKKVNDFCNTFDFVANGSFKALKDNVTLYDEPSDVLYIRTTDFNKSFSSALKYTDKKSYEFLKKSKLYGREVIISNVGDVGTVFRAPSWLGLPMTLGSNAVGLNSENFNSYIFWLFRAEYGQHLIQSIVTGSAQLKFNKTNLRALELLWPDELLLTKFENFELSIFEKYNSTQAEIRYLEELRDTLLPKLLSGELEVSSDA